MQHSGKRLASYLSIAARCTHKICQVQVALGVEQDVVRLHIPMYNTLLVDIPQGTGQFSHPEPYGFFRECLSRDMESQITTVHQVYHDVPGFPISQPAISWAREMAYRYSISWKLYRKLQRKGWLRCSSIFRSRIMLRTLSDRTTIQP